MRHKLVVGATVDAISAIAVVDIRIHAGASDAKTQNAVVHLSNLTNDLHAAFMAVKLETAMKSGPANVTLFVDLEGVRLVDSEQPLDLRWGPGHKRLAEYYDAFVVSGGRVLVCPHCANAAGIDCDSLRPGAQIATEAQLAKMLANTDKMLDY